jgi:hypothetical protein
MTNRRPLLLLDVDGPFNPWRAKATRRPSGYETYRLRPEGWIAKRPLRVWLHPGHGDLLGALTDRTHAELVWCTTWEDQANELIAPLIGLDPLPVIHWDQTDPDWKFAAVLDYAATRTVAWFDDAFDEHPDARDRFLNERLRRGLPTTLHYVDPRVGLTFDDVVRVATWFNEVSARDQRDR